ncbi:MAG: hypothetical protein ACO3IN_10820 [Steroidobacteraceae bacterium]
MAPKIFDTYVEGLNDVLRAFRQLPKEASKELRAASKNIAERHMAPAWRDAALGAGPWGEEIAASVKAASDRIPAVKIGGNRKVFSGGATATMVRWPSSTGEGRASFAPFESTNWLKDVRSYQGPALQEWGQAVDRIVAKWRTL